MGLQEVRPAETCTSPAQTDCAAVHAGEHVSDCPDEGAHEWVGTWAGKHTKLAEVWVDEHEGRPADGMDR